MPEITIRFCNQETTLERISALAAESGISNEQWVLRAIAEALGDYGLKSLPNGFEPRSLPQLFEAIGLLKP